MWLQAMVILIMTTLTIGQKCSLDSAIAMCNNEGWTKIPTGHQDRVEILSLSENKIKEVNDGDLDQFERLKILNIDNCELETVGRTAFKRLPKLSYIDLSHNRLTYLGNDVFQYNTDLSEVVLSYNQLQPHKFSPILISASIHTLKLKNCGIEEISSEMFSKLEKLSELDISDNNIITVSDRAFSQSSHLEVVLVDPRLFVLPAFSKIRSNTLSVNISTYNEQTRDVRKETSTSVTVFKSSYLPSTIQPTIEASFEVNSVQTSSVAAKSNAIKSTSDPEKVDEIVHVSHRNRATFQEDKKVDTSNAASKSNAIMSTSNPENVDEIVRVSHRNRATFEEDKKVDINDPNLTVKGSGIFGASIGNGEMYTIMAVSMLVGAGLCYALIQICRKRRSKVSNRVPAPPRGFVGRGPDSTSLVHHPVVYKVVPQYELEYLNDMYELPRTDSHTIHGFVPPVHLPMPSHNPPLPPRPPRRSVPSYHEYEYIQSSSGEVPTSTSTEY